MKNMAITDLVLVRPRSFPHAESNALAAGADDILANARVVSTVSEAVADCGFIAGQYCNVLVRIPANPEYCSLNLAMSVQLLTYELFLAREQPHSETQLELPLAPAGDVEHFYNHLHAVLNEIDFDDRTGHLMERLRRLFNRAQLDRNELNILRGILSAVQGRRGQSSRRQRE